MYTSPKRMILTANGEVVPAGPGVSGTLIVAEGSQITEERARKYGLMPPASEMPKQKPMVAPIIVRGPEGTVSLGMGGLKIGHSPIEGEASSPQQETGAKPWERKEPSPTPTSAPTDESGKALGLEE